MRTSAPVQPLLPKHIIRDKGLGTRQQTQIRYGIHHLIQFIIHGLLISRNQDNSMTPKSVIHIQSLKNNTKRLIYLSEISHHY